jgi:hypothetical protein
MALRLAQFLTEIINLPGGRGRQALKADNITAADRSGRVV